MSAKMLHNFQRLFPRWNISWACLWDQPTQPPSRTSWRSLPLVMCLANSRGFFEGLGRMRCFGIFQPRLKGQYSKATLTLKNAKVIRDITGSHGQLTDDLYRQWSQVILNQLLSSLQKSAQRLGRPSGGKKPPRVNSAHLEFGFGCLKLRIKRSMYRNPYLPLFGAST